MVRFASCDNYIDSHYDSLFAAHPKSIEVTRYGRVVKPMHKEGTM